jgi:molybdopterin molybdotransferase
MVAFDCLVRPMILRVMGHRRVFRPTREGRSLTRVRSSLGVREFARAHAVWRGGEWLVRQVGPEGSSNLRSLVAANGFMILPENCAGVNPGETVCFELFDDPPGREVPQ